MSSGTERDFRQISAVTEAHAIPRFGHTNSIAKLASLHRDVQEDYIRGILSFWAFLVTAFFIWAIVLIAFKFVLGRDRVGCAAGGGTIDVAKLRKDRLPRHVRRARILRAWHLQWAFLAVSVFIPITTLLVTRNGLTPLIASLDEVEDIADSVEAKAYVGISISKALIAQQEKLLVNFTNSDMNLTTLCPDILPNLHNNASVSSGHSHIPIDTIGEYLQVGLAELDTFIDEQARPTKTRLENIVQMTKNVDDSIEMSYANDWALKFFLMVVNVVNGFFLFGVFLSKQDIVSYNYQRFVSYVLFPFWGLLLVLCMILSCAFGTALILNADFCYGDGTPEGTIKNVIKERGLAETSLIYTSFLHYVEGCLGDSPLQFLKDMDPMLDYTMQAANLLGNEFSAYTPDEINATCSKDANQLIQRLPQLLGILDEIQQKIRAAVELTGCHQISPILRRILHGAACSETVEGLTWLFAGMVAITILGFFLLTMRAALFNAVVRAPRRKRRKEREKEFEEYKEYMATFYKDTTEWGLDVAAKDKKKISSGLDIPHVETFETEQSSSSGFQDEDVQHAEVGSDDGSDDNADESHVAYIESPKSKASSESSYESDYSSDSDVEERSFLSHSILGRILKVRSNNDDNQSSMFSVSALDFDSETPTETRMGILELQTPRRRRRHFHDPYAASLMASPAESSASRSPSVKVLHHGVVSPTTTTSPSLTQTTPSASTNAFSSLAPMKPKRLIQRTKGATKEA